MARMNVYLPDELADRARDAGLSVSRLTQEAVRGALSAHSTDAWLENVARLSRTAVTHDDVVAVVRQARDEFDRADA